MKKHLRFLSLILALVMVMGLCACGGNTADETVASNIPQVVTGDNANQAAEVPAAVESDKTVKLALSGALTTLDPLGTNAALGVLFFKQYNDGLFSRNEATNEFEPRVAESWDISDDGLTYTFHLRNDVKFHNGDLVTAEDVVFSFERAMQNSLISTYYASVEKVEATDDSTVVVTLKAANSAFMVNIEQFYYVVSKKEVTAAGDAFGTELHAASCGPYKLTRVDGLDSYIELEAFADYYRGEANIKSLSFQVVSDAAAGLIAFEAGELDWYSAPVTDWDSVSSNASYNSQLIAANHSTFVALNHSNGELADLNLRMAICYAIDKDACNAVAFDGLGEVASHFYSPSYNIGAPQEDMFYSYNPELAKEYLAKSSMPNGGKLSGTIVCNSGDFYEKMAVVIQQNLADIGLEIEIEALQSTAAMAKMRANEHFILCSGMPGRGDYDTSRNHLHSSSTVGYFKFALNDIVDHEKVDNLLDTACTLNDVAERTALYTELEQYLTDCAVMNPLFHKPLAYVWSKDLYVPANYPVNPQVYEWSWIA